MSLDGTIQSMIERIREDAGCEAEVRELQGEVLQFKVIGGVDYRLAFRNGTVELDEAANPTFHIHGERDVFDALFQRRLSPIAAIMTRRLKVTFDPVRLPLIKRIITAGLRPTRQEEA
jgi:putative sterol carrier protein